MAPLHLYLAGCVLLLTWTCPPCLSSPVLVSWRECANNAPLFNVLLRNVSDLLKNNVTWHGINVEKSGINTTGSSETVQACAPALSKTWCHKHKAESFSENECLESISKDLVHYEDLISSYIRLDHWPRGEEVPALTQILGIIHNLRTACSLKPTKNAQKHEDTAGRWGDEPYLNRQTMLMFMKAFHIRTITFNRAVSYITSGEHLKSSPS